MPSMRRSPVSVPLHAESTGIIFLMGDQWTVLVDVGCQVRGVCQTPLLHQWLRENLLQTSSQVLHVFKEALGKAWFDTL